MPSTTEAGAETASAATAYGVMFWILIVSLIAAVIAGYTIDID